MEKDKIILMQRKKIDELSKKVSALEQENALLKHDISKFESDRKKDSL